MPRMPRSYIKTSFFHVITQGINKNYIFSKHEDITYYINTMYTLSVEHNINIIAYCIMNNHAHILLKSESLKELSKYMQKLNTRYGKFYNRKYNRVGYVFRDRYKAEGIYSENQINNCINYIYNNPVKANICNRPENYPYSNYKKTLKNLEPDAYNFIDVIEDNNTDCKYTINRFLSENHLNLAELKNNKQKLRQLVIILKNKNNLSLRNIAHELKINRETIRKLYNS